MNGGLGGVLSTRERGQDREEEHVLRPGAMTCQMDPIQGPVWGGGGGQRLYRTSTKKWRFSEVQIQLGTLFILFYFFFC